MDRLPRDIAQDRMHHDIVRLLDEYNLVRSPQMQMGANATSLSPPICSPNGYLGSGKPAGHGKKSRKTSAKGANGKESKEAKVKRKKSQDGKGSLVDSSSVLSPVDSMESSHTYLSDVASPPLLTPPYQQSPSIQLNHLQGLAVDGHISLSHLGMGGKQEALGGTNRMVFESVAPRLSHLPSSNGQPMSNASMAMNLGGAGGMNGQCDWLAQMQSGMVQNPYNAMRNQVQAHARGLQQSQHGMITSLHNGLPNTSLSQIVSYQGLANTAALSQSHLMQQPPQGVSVLNVMPNGNPHPMGQSYCGADPRQADLPQMGGNGLQVHAISAQDTQLLQTSLPTSISQSMATTQFLTPPSQHGYSSPMDNTPSHQLHLADHPFLTPSPESPDQWSSSSPHSNMSDWSEGISSPPTSMHSQKALLSDQVFK